MTEPVRIALAGFGAWGQMHARALLAIDGTALTAIFCRGETSEAAARAIVPAVTRYRSYVDMLAAGDFEVVIVAVPNHLHASFAIAAIEAEADVILEKPLGVTLAECDAVIAAAETRGRHVAVNHELRVSHQWGKVREIVASGELGEVRHQHFSLFRHGFRQGSGHWRYDPKRVGSWILEELVHFVDLVAWYAAENGAPDGVIACASSAGGLADTVTANLAWPNGSSALVTQCLAGFEHHTVLEMAGTEGALRTWWAGASDRTTSPSFGMSARRRGEERAEAIAIPYSGEVFELEENVRRALMGFRSGSPVMALRDARASVAICLAIEEAIETGGIVRLR